VALCQPEPGPKIRLDICLSIGVSAIEEKDRSWRSKLPALLNDILIALCARRAGATLLTYNKDDFRPIRRHKAFFLRILEAD